MSGRRVLVLMAITAALVWAPSSVSAASPNQLSQASVSPLSGTTSTPFVVTVRYRSSDGNAATAVTISAAGQMTAMTLAAGTGTDGIWSGTATLPPGDWDITVQASVAKGSQPSLVAGTVSVTGASGPPSSPDGSIPSSAEGPAGEGGGTSSSAAPRPVATPVLASIATPAPARASTAAAPSQPETGPVHEAAAPAGLGRRDTAPARSSRPDPADSSEGAQRSATASPSGTGTPASNRDVGDLSLFMLIGTLAVAGVALVGSAWIFLAGRRERQAAIDPGVSSAATVDQRALRRARLRSTEDPILAAMGLPDEDVAPKATPPPGVKPGSRSRRTPKR
jgi:hypothetical protein